MQAKDIMTTNVVSISPAASVRHAVAVMLQNNISGLPVVSDEGRVCGMLTEGDLLLRREIRVSLRSSRVSEVTSELDLERYVRTWVVRGRCHVSRRHCRIAGQRGVRHRR